MPSPASKRDRDVNTRQPPFLVSFSQQFAPLWHQVLISAYGTFLGLICDFQPISLQPWPPPEVLTFYSRPGVGRNCGKLVKLPMEITQVTAWDFSLHSNYKGSLFNPLWATQRACSVKRANLLSNRSSFSGTWLYCGSRSSFWNKGRQNVTKKIVSARKDFTIFSTLGSSTGPALSFATRRERGFKIVCRPDLASGRQREELFGALGVTNESHSKGSRRVTSNGTTQHQHKCTRDCHQGLSPEIVTRDGHQIQSPDRPDTNTVIALFGWVTNWGASKFQTLTWVFQASAVQCYLTEPQITGTQSKWFSVSRKLWPASLFVVLKGLCFVYLDISTFSVFSLWWCHPVGDWVSLF